MRGDYKTVGGKLVTVNFDVQDGHLRNVQVSGDFFLYPEEALGDIRQALEGLPVSIGERAIAERVGTAVGADVEMVGFSPEAVARAVGRGLGRDDQ
jgi:Bacterial lipoate protein ligase C-terminus